MGKRGLKISATAHVLSQKFGLDGAVGQAFPRADVLQDEYRQPLRAESPSAA